MLYGCHNLCLYDRDYDQNKPNQHQIWGGVPNAAFSICSQTQHPTVQPNTTNKVNIPQHVRQLQNHLLTLGFLIKKNPDGTFDMLTQWAVREFQIYAKMARVARIKDSAPANSKQGAHIVAQMGIVKGQTVSVYVDSLESVETGTGRYTGQVSGVVNEKTRTAIEHWLKSNWRCPIIVEAWNVSKGARKTLFKNNKKWSVNVWLHDDIPTSKPRFFVRDFSGYYTLPPGRSQDDMHIIGDFQKYMKWCGPRSIPSVHCWPEAEILPLTFNEQDPPTMQQLATFKVVRSVSEVECIGYFDSVNCYDNAFVSLGPCHWTLGIVGEIKNKQGKKIKVIGEGELCGFFAYLKFIDANAFTDAIEYFGVCVDENWVDSKGVPNGSNLYKAAGCKYTGWMALQQENGTFSRLAHSEEKGNYFKNWHWQYRFVMAGRTITGYRQHMWDMARIRIRDIGNTAWGDKKAIAEIPVDAQTSREPCVKDVFTSERAVAIILRWHIRLPGDICYKKEAGKILHDAHRIAKKTIAPTLDWKISPEKWDDNHEKALIQGLLEVLKTQNNKGLKLTVRYVHDWPRWVSGKNPSKYTLYAPYAAALDEKRNSLFPNNFRDIGLPPTPY